MEDGLGSKPGQDSQLCLCDPRQAYGGRQKQRRELEACQENGTGRSGRGIKRRRGVGGGRHVCGEYHDEAERRSIWWIRGI